MKIVDVTATPVNIPLKAGYRWSVGILTGFPKTIVEVKTDAGITGVGETPSDTHAAIINGSLGPTLKGKDPFDIMDCETSCVPEWRSALNMADASTARAFGGVEIALWDIKGKALSIPIYEILGGQVRSEVSFSEYFSYRMCSDGTPGEQSIKDIVDYCIQQNRTHGSTFFEGKVGHNTPSQDLEMISALRKEFGDEITIRLDANYGWSPATASRMLRELEPLNIQSIEDPVFGFENMARLRRNTSIPFSTHEIDVPHAVASGAPDSFVANIAALGGIRDTLRIAHACDVMGLDFWFYSGDAGIMTAAYLQVAAAIPSIRGPHQSLGRWQSMDVIDEDLLNPQNGVVPVPQRPGLGVTLNQESLATCHEHYVHNGPCKRFMNPEGRNYLQLPRH